MELKRPEGEVIVRPMPEHRADEELSAVYRDLKATLGVPWVGVVVQAFAYCRRFFLEAWRQFRPTAGSDFFHKASDDLRLLAWDEIASSFAVPSQRPALEAAGYAHREIIQLLEMLELFDYGRALSFPDGCECGKGARHGQARRRGTRLDRGAVSVAAVRADAERELFQAVASKVRLKADEYIISAIPSETPQPSC